jgi:hypothetical protein
MSRMSLDPLSGTHIQIYRECEKGNHGKRQTCVPHRFAPSSDRLRSTSNYVTTVVLSIIPDSEFSIYPPQKVKGVLVLD